MIGRLVKTTYSVLGGDLVAKTGRSRRRAGPLLKGKRYVLGSSLFQGRPGQTVNINRSRRATVIRLSRCFVSASC
jgi:hypothetical protein